ncbi:ABC transporter permease [Microbulbifer sp. 2205BS26-8]|uniref:ABC transporter permease n=1 Tax=Microbulbifer sp. 2205BS26-8 TaxID=3064386 RepID=UPI00273DE44D|nr:ABC transporter permease [Microbulbifer sp. 2205BS26-8]MDP5210776.1 ABC transporter permease [Microbulbifer sp. 2205BS26-8]
MEISMLRVRKLFAVHLKEFRRDFGSVFFSFLFPMFFLVVLIVSSLVSPTFNFEFGLVDSHKNPSAFGLVESLASEHLSVRSIDKGQAETELKEGKLQAVLILPAEGLSAGGEIDLLVGQSYEGFARIVVQAALAKLQNIEREGEPTYQFHTEVLTDEVNSEFSFMFPGMLAMALLQLGLFATATPILRARERGTLRHLLLTPLGVHELLISQICFRLMVAFLQVSVLLIAGMFVVELTAMQWVSVMGVALLGAIMLICMGYALAGMATNLESGMAAVMIANFAMLFAGNIFSDPSDNWGLSLVAHFMPVSYLADAFRQIINNSSGIWPLWLDMCALLGWSALALTIAIRTFRFDMQARQSSKKEVAI